jgi:hypothetical protein
MPNIIKQKPKNKIPAKQTKKAPKKQSQLATLAKKALAKSSPADYYNCLMNYAQQGFYDQQTGKKLKIHACCKKCKLNAPALNNQHGKELVKLITSYKQAGDLHKQIGTSLAKLLKPIK